MSETQTARPDAATGERPVGLIIAGGAASRFGGGDKTLRRLGDRALLAWIIERLAPQCATLVLSANGPADRFAAFDLPVVADAPEDRGCGPLAGVLAGLEWTALHRPEASLLLTVPGDCPSPPADLAARLRTARNGQHAQVAAARSGGRAHPLTALWPITVREELRRALRQDGEHRVRAVLARIGAVWVDWPATPFDPFTNINTPDDLATATLRFEAGCR